MAEKIVDLEEMRIWYKDHRKVVFFLYLYFEFSTIKHDFNDLIGRVKSENV